MLLPLPASTKFLDSEYHVNGMMDKANASLHMIITMFLKHNSVYIVIYSHFKSLFFFVCHMLKMDDIRLSKHSITELQCGMGFI